VDDPQDERPEPLFDGLGEHPRCKLCGTVMHVIDGGFECRWCGYREEIPWVERPRDADDLPGIG